jgi:hypothetical protein
VERPHPLIDTLAAHAEAGDFKEAINQYRPLEFLDYGEENAENAHKKINLYSDHKPYGDA